MDDRTIVESGMPGPGVGDATRVMPAPPMGGMGYGDRTQVAITVTCPVCQTPNPPAEQYCQDCGLLFGSNPQDVEPLPDLAQLPRLVDASGREFALNPGANTVGRESADVLLVDPTVSRRHAVLTLEAGQLVVEDQGSTNGSYVAGRRLAPNERATAFDGDAVRFGNVHLTLNIPGAASRPAGAAPAAEGVAPAAPAEDRGAPVGFLVMPDGSEQPLFEGVNAIGRRSSNQIAINDAFMSGKHAEIRCGADGHCEMVDVGSTNGSFFNGERMAPNAPLSLTDGTAFTMGKTPVTFRSAGQSAGAPEVEATRLGDFELPADTTVAISAPGEGEPGW